MPKGKTLREVIVIGIEGLPGSIDGWVIDGDNKKLMHSHLTKHMKCYALAHGVILEDKDIIGEVNAVIAELKGVAVARTKTPK